MMTNPSPRSCNQAAEVPSSKVTDKLPCSPWRNSRIVAAFVSRILSMINFPRKSVTATEIVAWWTSMPIYFSWLITALLSVSGDTNNHNLQQSGRLLYCVTSPEMQQLISRIADYGTLRASHSEGDIPTRCVKTRVRAVAFAYPTADQISFSELPFRSIVWATPSRQFVR